MTEVLKTRRAEEERKKRNFAVTTSPHEGYNASEVSVWRVTLRSICEFDA